MPGKSEQGKGRSCNEAHVASPMSRRVTEINADAILICAMKMEVSVKI